MTIECGLKALGLPAGKVVSDALTRYINEIILFNNIHSFVATSDFNAIARDHIMDSLSAAPIIKDLIEEKRVNGARCPVRTADVGSGAGLPGVPLAIVFPDISFTLIEKSRKRCNFLENVIAILGLKNISLKNCALESLKDTFDFVTFRAVSALKKDWVDALLSITKDGGAVLSYKGKKSEVDKEIENLPYNITVKRITNPIESDPPKERHLVIIKK